MAKKVLLGRLTRPGKDGKLETLMPNGEAVDLTKDDIATLDRLTKATGKRYYRDPVNESAAEDERADDEEGDEPTEAETFVNRAVDEIAALSDEQRAAALAAEEAGKGRSTLIARLQPAAGDKDDGL
jgi:hypothetical protein